MVVNHNTLRMVIIQMPEVRNRSQGTHTHRAETPLHSIGQHAKALVNSVTRAVDREAAARNLTPTEFAAIRLFLVDLEWTATELAQMLSVDASAMSRAVGKLVDTGVLRRRRPRNDRRIVLLKLTEDGVALGLELHERAHSYEENLTKGISAENLEICLATIKDIVANHAALEGSNSVSAGQVGEVASDGSLIVDS